MKNIFAVFLFALSSYASAQCTSEGAFGIAFGSASKNYGAIEIKNRHPFKQFATYRLDNPPSSDKSLIFTVDAERKTGRVFSVTVSRTVTATSTEQFNTEIIPMMRKLATEASKDSGIQLDISGHPPYFTRKNDPSLSIDWDIAGLPGHTVDVTCTNEQMLLAVQRTVQKSDIEALLKPR